MRCILASSSPRRREIMDLFHIDYEIQTSDVEESSVFNASARVNAMASAYMKANSVYEKERDTKEKVVLGADTVVVLGVYQFGKPKNEEEEKLMLQALSGKTHEVITGYAIIGDKFRYTDYVVSKVTFKTLTQDMIENYVATGEGKDKAGSYAVQGISSVFIEKIEGDYQNIIGLPISKIYDVLKDKFAIDLLAFEKKSENSV